MCNLTCSHMTLFYWHKTAVKFNAITWSYTRSRTHMMEYIIRSPWRSKTHWCIFNFSWGDTSNGFKHQHDAIDRRRSDDYRLQSQPKGNFFFMLWSVSVSCVLRQPRPRHVFDWLTNCDILFLLAGVAQWAAHVQRSATASCVQNDVVQALHGHAEVSVGDRLWLRPWIQPVASDGQVRRPLQVRCRMQVRRPLPVPSRCRGRPERATSVHRVDRFVSGQWRRRRWLARWWPCGRSDLPETSHGWRLAAKLVYGQMKIVSQNMFLSDVLQRQCFLVCKNVHKKLL